MVRLVNILVVALLLIISSCERSKPFENQPSKAEDMVLNPCCDYYDFYLCSARVLRWEIASVTNGWGNSFYDEIVNKDVVDSIYGASGLEFYGTILDSVIRLHEEKAPLLAYVAKIKTNGDSVVRKSNEAKLEGCDVISRIQKSKGKRQFFQTDLVDCFYMPDSNKYNLLSVSNENYSLNLEISLVMLLGLVDDCP